MSPKQECEALMNDLMPLAEKMLKQFGEFYPYGGYMKSNGEIVHVGAKDPKTDSPKSKDLIAILKHSFRELVEDGQCKATGIEYDVVIPLCGESRKSDAIQFCLDHGNGYSAQFFLPYQLIDHQIIYGETFAQEGKHEIFEKRVKSTPKAGNGGTEQMRD